MKLHRLFFVPLFALVACSRADVDAGTTGKAKDGDCGSCSSCDDHDAPSTPAMGITLTEKTAISAILAAPEQFEGKRVLVSGAAVGVCETRGCWVDLKSDDDASKKIRVKVQDGEIVFPLTCKGNEVTVEGVVEKLVTEKGTSWRIRGLGAKFDS